MSDWTFVTGKGSILSSSTAAVHTESQVGGYFHADICSYLEDRVQRKYQNARTSDHTVQCYYELRTSNLMTLEGSITLHLILRDQYPLVRYDGGWSVHV